jgi:integrase
MSKMSKALNRLTDSQIKNATAHPDGRARLLADGGNLLLAVSLAKDGSVNRSWIFKYRVRGTKRERRMGLGPFRDVPLKKARERAAVLRLALAEGRDPIADRETLRASRPLEYGAPKETFRQAAMEYMARNESSWTSLVHRRQWVSTLDTYVLPVLGKKPVGMVNEAGQRQVAITTADVLAVLTPIWDTKRETASRIRGRLESILNFAKVTYRLGWNVDDGGCNPATWDGHLKEVLPRKKRAVQHYEAIHYEDIAAFMVELRSVGSVAALALEFVILTACRSNEAIEATWNEIDPANRTWNIPRDHLKRDGEEKDLSHTIPLSDAAMAVLRRLQGMLGNTAPDGRIAPIGDWVMRDTLQSLRPGITVHGMRSCFRSWAGACTSHPRDVCETALGHAVGNAVERSYQRDALLAKRRVLMADWADYCDRAPADVVELKASA